MPDNDEVVTPAPDEQLEQLETKFAEFVSEVEDRLSVIETRLAEIHL